MPVLDSRTAHENRRPAALPGTESCVEILHIGRFEELGHPTECAEFRRVIQRTAAASVEYPRQIFAWDRLVAAKRKIGNRFAPPHRLTRFFAARALREEDLGRGA